MNEAREVKPLRSISVETPDGRQLCRVRNQMEYEAILKTAATLYITGAVPSVWEGVELVSQMLCEEELAELRARQSLQ